MSGVAGLVVLLPALAAVVTLVVGHRVPAAAASIGIIVTAIALVCALVVGIGWWGRRGVDVSRLTSFSAGRVEVSVAVHSSALVASVLVLAAGIALLVQVYSVAYLRGDPRYPSYVAFVLVFTSAMALVAVAESLFVLLVGWEVMGICSYLLISQHWEHGDAREGAVKAFLVTRLGDVGFLFGIFVLGLGAGSFDIGRILAAESAGRLDPTTAAVASVLLLCGVVGKSAQFPLHSWLPDAMPGPTPITALIHAATMVAAGVFFVAEMLPVFVASAVTTWTLALISAITMLGGALFACAAGDLKRVLAWSTVSQLAYMFGALAVGGYDAGVLHLLAHGIFKALLFLAAGVVIEVAGTRRLDELAAWLGRTGPRTSVPVTFATMTVGLAALAGLPPFVGFFSKDRVLATAYDGISSGDHVGEGLVVLCAGLVTAVLTAGYATRVWLLLFGSVLPGPAPQPAAEPAAQPVTDRPDTDYLFDLPGAEGGARTVRRPREASSLMTVPLVVLAVLAVAGGAAVVDPAFLGPHRARIDWVMSATTTVLAVATIGFTYRAWARADGSDPAAILGRLRRPLVRELWWDHLVVGAARSLVGAGTRGVVAGDRDVVETYVDGAADAARGAGGLVRWAHAGRVRQYLAAVVVGAGALGLLMAALAR
jgi:NADH-quinone oxidoreductase subunit L